jgi:hypothetical protein
MVHDMLLFMYGCGKEVVSDREVAEALRVPLAQVSTLYREANDLGWVVKFADGPGMFRLTGRGRQEAIRIVSMRGDS